MANEDLIEVDDLPEQILNRSLSQTHQDNELLPLEEAEARYLSKICKTQSLPIDELAQQLGVSTRTLYRKLQKFDLKYE